jgi:hypothetical protein
MAEYFNKFPKTAYRITYNENTPKNFDMPVNIMVRIGVLMNTLDKLFYYYEYEIKEGETPEIVAEKYYGDPEAHWLVLLTNNIVDPQYDWVLHYDAFKNYLIDKYGSIANSKTTVDRYELVYKKEDVETGTITYTPIIVTSREYDDLVTGGTPVAEPQNYTVYTVNNKQVRIYPEYLRTIYAYDAEVEKNESRRLIKLIKKDYYETIKLQFNEIMADARPSRKEFGIRSLR